MVVAVLMLAAQLAAGEPAAERRREVVALVREDCGSCHGMTLQGGLGPSLLPADLAGKPDDWLAGTILDGVPGTPMPGWRRFLRDEEALWIVRELKRGFPDER